MEDGTNKTRRKQVMLQLMIHWSFHESETAQETESLKGNGGTGGMNLPLIPCPAKSEQAFVVDAHGKPLGVDSGSPQRD